jgi:3-isopropylmalate/(R)-2-methylmalate dehydratase small subunit
MLAYYPFRLALNLLIKYSKLSQQIQRQVEVNLPEQTITLKVTGEKRIFDISGYKKANMINGFDDIDYYKT